MSGTVKVKLQFHETGKVEDGRLSIRESTRGLRRMLADSM